ncbi:OmpH family outer membrane protein [Flavobacterium sp. NRK F10]|uniref:OmpH family outer membrane protein n=1 Tax=Flavobacterium sp. NRK F10 TaxID=2954931 RepID=UPI0020915347|nr:OmpH family outer membrane protein [Flavobacterium sp. NRK F10]MCO6175181.1 OmpH family outer membrane protein [Flavobacterium sp. NRK F10]
MKKILFILLSITATFAFSQTRGIRIGYIDMEYILEKVPSYAEANNQLELKAQKWKQEIEIKKNEITKLKEALKVEKPLLTKELIEEREEEISFLEKELLDFQEKKFGAQGDLIVQKSTIVKPIQDQVFTAIQDIAEKKKYDFIFDRSSDLTMLFAKQQHDISDLVIRTILRSEKREELTKKQLKAQEAQEAKEDMLDENPDLAERQKKLDEKKAAREKMLEERRLAREKLIEERKQAAADKRKKLEEEKENKKSGTEIENENIEESASDQKITDDTSSEDKSEAEISAEEKRAQIQEERKRKLEERKKAIEEKKQKAIEAREAAKKAKEENNNNSEENENQ